MIKPATAKKKATVLLEQDGRGTPQQGAPITMSISDITDTRHPATQDYDAVDRARAALGSVQARIAALRQERESLMATAQAELIASGVGAIVAPIGGSKRPVIGTEVAVTEYWYATGRLRTRHGYYIYYPHSNRVGSTGPHVDEFGMLSYLGAHTVLLIDGDDALLAPIPGANDDEGDHRRALGRLRTLAASEGTRIRACDLDVEVVDPMGTPLHTGSVLSAFAFILGVELDNSNGTVTR